MKEILSELFTRNKYKWLFVIMVYFGLSLSIINGVQYSGLNTSFYEIILTQTNQEKFICFVFTFLFLLLSSDFGNYKRINNNNLKSLTLVILMSLIFMLIFVLINLLVCSLINEASFINEWMQNGELSRNRYAPKSVMCISILFLILRFIFIGSVISLVNIVTKKKIWSSISVVAISILDYDFNRIADVSKTINILPIVNTKVSAVELYSVVATELPRVSYLFSIIYWLILILLIWLYLFLRIFRERKSRIILSDCINKK